MSKVVGMGAVDESGHILCVKLLMLFHLSTKRFLLGVLSMPLSSKELTSIQFRSFHNLLIYFIESAIDRQLLLEPSHELFKSIADPSFENVNHAVYIFSQNVLLILFWRHLGL